MMMSCISDEFMDEIYDDMSWMDEEIIDPEDEYDEDNPLTWNLD